ncbi:MAG: aldo/keto reductase [Propionibacterium sp.]|nr:aldo/keto reductase [Propionibacterium sp.]
MTKMITVAGEQVPVLGQGTWKMGDSPSRRDSEVTALRTGIELGMTLIDTAEMYGSGRSEQLVGEAIRGRRDDVYLVSKVMPSNASRRGTIRACDASMRRLGTDHLDLYLLHWEGRHPLAETVEAFEELRRTGKIRAWGVSNFDRDRLREVTEIARAGHRRDPERQNRPATNQVLLNLESRWSETGLLDDQLALDVPLMAYSPIGEGGLARSRALASVAARHRVTAAQVALSWVISRPGVFAIPKASSEAHVRENAAAADIRLTADDLAELDAAFPKPDDDAPLELI